MIVCVAGSPSIDRLFEVDSLAVGEIHRPSHQLRVPGGKGLNVARAVAALGEQVIATGVLAGHSGHWVQESLAAEGIEGRFAWTVGETRSSLSVADTASRCLTEFYEADVTMTSAAWHELERLTEEVVPGASWLSLSGSVPAGASDAGYAALIEFARAAGVPAAVDTRGGPLAVAVVG